MDTYEFTLIIEGNLDDEAVIVSLFEAGCDDATFGISNGVGVADFAREAESAVAAINTAVRDVMSVIGLRVRRIEPDDLVTIPEIAERLQRTPESIRLLANGERGGGRFPLPVSHIASRHRLWRWSDVARWAGTISEEDLRTADVIAAFNALLELNQIQERDPEMMEHLRLKAL